MTRLIPSHFNLVPDQFRGFAELGDFDHKHLGWNHDAVEPTDRSSGSLCSAVHSDKPARGRFDVNRIDEKFRQTFDVIGHGSASPFETAKHIGTETDITSFNHLSPITGELTSGQIRERGGHADGSTAFDRDLAVSVFVVLFGLTPILFVYAVIKLFDS